MLPVRVPAGMALTRSHARLFPAICILLTLPAGAPEADRAENVEVFQSVSQLILSAENSTEPD